MAMVHVDEGRLPDSRALLYDKTIDLLLSRWEETKREDEVPRLRQLLRQAGRTDSDLKAALAGVAYDVHTQAGSAAGDEEVADIGEAFLCQALSRLNKREMGWGQALLAVIKERAGLLIERAPGQFAFPHRTFQEYLAGMHLAAQPESKFKAEALYWAGQGVGWWPMVLFAVEYLVYVNPQLYKPLQLVSELCPRDKEPQTTADWQAVWLAGDALQSLGLARAEDSEWGRDLTDRVRDRLAAMLVGGCLPPLERAAAGRVLSQLGDPRPGVGTILRSGQKLPDIVWGGRSPGRDIHHW